MNERAVVSWGAFSVTTGAKRAHLGVSMGLFDPSAGFPSVTLTRGVSILSGFSTILGG